MRVHPFARACIAVLGVAIISAGSIPTSAMPTGSIASPAKPITSTAARARRSRMQRALLPGCEALRRAALPMLATRCSQTWATGSTASSRTAATGIASTSVLYAFNGLEDGGRAESDLVGDGTGALYGTTYLGGDQGPFCASLCGVVYKLMPPAPGQTKWKESVIHTFTNANGDGANPSAGLITDEHGALYGTTQIGGADESGCFTLGCGTVFKLTPPGRGRSGWTETVLHTFTGVNGDGYAPVASLLLDRRGALYGTTPFDLSGGCGGLGCGNVFKLTPPAPGQHAWTESILYAFTGGADGGQTFSGVIADERGNLYGTASGGTAIGLSAGVVFKLTAPTSGRTAWTQTVLHSFGGAPDGNMPSNVGLVGFGNALYGMTIAGGFGCSIYGGCGLVFGLTPPTHGQGPWIESVLHSFSGGDGANPFGRLLVYRGALYGTTENGGQVAGSPFGPGTIFKLAPPASVTSGWTFSLLHAFGGTPDGSSSVAGLTADHGALYGTTQLGGGDEAPAATVCSFGFGTITGCGTVFVVR
jgi:uncharacterized repeat protein (TIGR03803 family)